MYIILIALLGIALYYIIVAAIRKALSPLLEKTDVINGKESLIKLKAMGILTEEEIEEYQNEIRDNIEIEGIKKEYSKCKLVLETLLKGSKLSEEEYEKKIVMLETYYDIK